MFDSRWIRENPDTFDAGLVRRGLEPLSAEVLALDKARRQAQTQAQEVQSRRNALSKQVGAAKSKGEDAAEIIAEVSALKDEHVRLEEEVKSADQALKLFLEGLPNTPAPDVPEGADEAANLEIRQHGQAPAFDFEPKQHFEIGEAMGRMDFEAASRLSGARFVVLRGALARMERALGAFMLDLHTKEFGYTEVSPPILVRDTALYGTGQLPKFAEDLYRTEDDYWLIPTAEVPLTNLVAGSVLSESDLPLRVTALTPCFRSEAGAAGRDTRGMLRQHQFSKVELVSICLPDQSDAELERMTGCAEEVLKRLGLHYRVMLLSTGDMGFSARKTHDLEVWLPGQDAYREISSCSSCGDFQARRMDGRYRPDGEKGTRHLHTLNGSGLAVGRALIAVLENYQNADGSVRVPEALQPYMDGAEVIGADG
jgi:seryl-tRNA synthetase